MNFKSLIIPMAVALGFAASSCTSEDPEYTPTPEMEAPEVYFSNQNDSTKFEVGETEQVFTVPVYRKSSTGSATYPLTVTGTDVALFTYPSSVTFEDGKVSTSFEVSYNGASLTPAKNYDITFSVGEGKNAPYWRQTLTYRTIVMPWEDVIGPNGEEYALYTDVALADMYGVPSMEWEVKLQRSPINVGLYRVVDPYGPSSPWYSQGSYAGPTYLYFNIADPEFGYLCNDKSQANVGAVPTKFFTGFTINPNEGELYFTTWFNVMLAANNRTYDEAANSASLYNQLVPGAVTYDNGLVTIPRIRAKLVIAHAGTTETQWVNCGDSYIKFPGYVAPEAPATGWEGVGTAEFTDPWIATVYQISTDPVSWEVEVEREIGNPGSYRMVNTYKAGVCPFGVDYSDDLYITFNISDATCPLIDLSYTGVDDEQNGEVYVGNFAGIFAGAGNSIADIIAAGFADTYDAQTYTLNIPNDHAGVMFPNSATPDDIYTANLAIDGKIVLSAEATAQVKKDMAAQNYVSNFVRALKSYDLNVTEYKLKAQKQIKNRKAVRKATLAL